MGAIAKARDQADSCRTNAAPQRKPARLECDNHEDGEPVVARTYPGISAIAMCLRDMVLHLIVDRRNDGTS